MDKEVIAMKKLLVALLPFLVACGRGSIAPTAVLIPSSIPTVIVSGRDGSPVAAQVSGNGSVLNVTAPGYLALDTIDRGRPIYLWPNDAQIIIADTFSFVYNGVDGNFLGRLGDSTGIVSVVPSSNIMSDKYAVSALTEGITILNQSLAAAGIRLVYVINAPGQVKAFISIDPADAVFASGQAGAATYNTEVNNVITQSKIVILNIDFARTPIVYFHELTHTFGLYHSKHPGPMMVGPELYEFKDFVELDRIYMKLIRTRQPGTRLTVTTATENDRTALSASGISLSRVEVIVCP